MQHGITFSHRQLESLNCDPNEALKQALEFKFDFLRLCLYWDEIEIQENRYDWQKISHILKQCQKDQQKVVLTVGVKAPRWPEFYFPGWLNDQQVDHPNTQQAILRFISQAISTLKDFSCIKYYQVENEALDPSGPEKMTMPLTFLKQEIDLIRKIDPSRQIISTLWGNQLSQRKNLCPLAAISDLVGIDLYYRHFIKKIAHQSIYIGPNDRSQKIAHSIQKCQVTYPDLKVWIMELQAEPWEASEADYLSDQPSSISPEKVIENYHKARQLPLSAILFWGYEYWYYRSVHGDDRYLHTINELMHI